MSLRNIAIILLFCLAFTGRIVFAERAVYDYSGNFTKEFEQNLLDADYMLEFSSARNTVEYGAIEAKYINLWDRELNLIYQKLLDKLESGQRNLLIESQVGWVRWHTYEMQFVDAVWINNSKLGTQGAIQELKAQKQRLRNRTAELMEYYYLLSGKVEFEYQGKYQNQAKSTEYEGANFRFFVPAGWKAEKQSQGYVLTNESIPGYIVITVLKVIERSQAFKIMESGINNQHMDLQMTGRIYSQGGDVWGAAYSGLYLVNGFKRLFTLILDRVTAAWL